MCREKEIRAASIPPSFKELEDAPSADEAFICQICLDLVFKPVVQSCGHIFCFWCAQRSMNGKRQSHCPLCRRPYVHFPRVCEMLHFFVMKAWPKEYSRRANETQEMEESKRVFSPRLVRSSFKSPHKIDDPEKALLRKLGRHRSLSHDEADCQDLGVSTMLYTCIVPDNKLEDTRCSDKENVNTLPVERSSNADSRNTLCMEDFLCASCGKLLYRPVALNCGKVFCESCVMTADSSTVSCPSCRTHHPGGAIHVCLILHDYLERSFPMCYRQRATEMEILQRSTQGVAQRITDSDQQCDARDDVELNETTGRIVHIGAGCDGCGMFPIVGHRYRCRDCIERIGYDLCGQCYRGRDSLDCGRFNQHHTSDHHMEEILPDFRLNGTPLNLNLDNGIIARRRRQRLLTDFDDYIDSFV